MPPNGIPLVCLLLVCLLGGISLVSSVCCEERLYNASARIEGFSLTLDLRMGATPPR